MKIAGQHGPGDDGSVQPPVAAALAAYGNGQGSEHALLVALAASRLLVPVVAMLAPQQAAPDGDTIMPRHRTVPGAGREPGQEKTSEMALPTVIGNDGRRALPAFSSLHTLARWRASARPVPVAASRVWQAAAAEASAVVIDIAGPVPVAVDGARLAALAAGRPVPPPHEDGDVVALAAAVLHTEPVISGFQLLPGQGGSDLSLVLTLAPGDAAARVQAVARAVTAIMAGAGGTLRRGVEVAVTQAGRPG